MARTLKRVLLVEDDADVRRFLTHVLEEAGYAVATAVTFIRARDLIETRQVELLITDIVLPGGGLGTDLADLAERHDVKTLLYTGHPHWIGNTKPNIPCLTKPFRPSELMEILARIEGGS